MCRLLLGNRKGVISLHNALIKYSTTQINDTSLYEDKTSFEGKNYWSLYSWGLTDYGPSRGKTSYPNGLYDLLEELEFLMGGHGNGLVLVGKKPDDVRLWKGLNVLNVDLTTRMLSEKYSWAVWHTRICTSGGITDENCHPFVAYEGKNTLVWAMNGSEPAYNLNSYAHNKTDAEVIGLMVLKLRFTIPDVFTKFGSVFVGVYNGRPFAVPNRGDLMRYDDGAGGVVFASELPDDLPGVSQCDFLVWYDGKSYGKRTLYRFGVDAYATRGYTRYKTGREGGSQTNNGSIIKKGGKEIEKH